MVETLLSGVGVVAWQVKLVTTASYVKVPVWDTHTKSWLFCLRAGFLLMYLGKQQQMVPSTQTPATHMENSNVVPGSCLWNVPALDIVVIQVAAQQIDLCIFPCLSLYLSHK